MKPSISYGLVGAGGFGAYHLAALRELEQTGEARLAAVCDPTIHRLPALQAEFAVRKLRVHNGCAEMLAAEPGLEAVTITAPIPYHHRMVLACLERDVFVYLEKPPVPLLDQFEELAAARGSERIAVGFQWISSNWSQLLKRHILAGEYGELREIRVGACWTRGADYYSRAPWAGRLALDGEPVFDGPATNALSHLIHEIMFLASDEPDGFALPQAVAGELYRARPIESYDTANLRGSFRSGATFQAILSHAGDADVPFEVRVIGTRGWARVFADGQRFESHSGPVAEFVPESGAELLLKNYRHFNAFITGAAARPSTLLRDTRGYMLATNGLLLSSEGVHQIGAAWIDHPREGAYAIKNLSASVEDFLHHGTTFHEAGLPWAVEGREIALVNFDPSLNDRARGYLIKSHGELPGAPQPTGLVSGVSGRTVPHSAG